MKEKTRRSAWGWAAARWLLAAAIVIAVLASGLFSGLMNRAGLLYLVLGTAAAALMGFRGREIAAAFGHAAGSPGTGDALARSAHFWEAAARNAWILGALGSALNFTIVLSTGSEGIGRVAEKMIQSFLVTLYGLVLAVLCLVPAMKLAGRAGRIRSGDEDRPRSGVVLRAEAGPHGLSPDRIAGYVLFAAVIVLTVVFLVGGRPLSGPLPIGRILWHWPAVLVVIGGSVALALFIGRDAGARAWTLGFAMTGLIGLMMGLIQGLFGFAHRDVNEIAAACAFIISASSLSLLGLVAAAAPFEDREVMEGRRDEPGSLSRLFWALFPLMTFLFLILTFIMVVTPMERTVK